MCHCKFFLRCYFCFCWSSMFFCSLLIRFVVLIQSIDNFNFFLFNKHNFANYNTKWKKYKTVWVCICDNIRGNEGKKSIANTRKKKTDVSVYCVCVITLFVWLFIFIFICFTIISIVRVFVSAPFSLLWTVSSSSLSFGYLRLALHIRAVCFTSVPIIVIDPSLSKRHSLLFIFCSINSM